MSSPSSPLSDVQRRAIWALSYVEAGYDRVEADPHGNGLTHGFLGWNQRDGSILKLLDAYRKADPGAFVRFFGKDWEDLVHRAASPAPISPLRRSPWSWRSLQRFQGAGLYAPFQAVQVRLALAPELTEAAVHIAHVLGVRELAGLVVGLYRVARVGPRGALEPAQALATRYAAEPLTRPSAAFEILKHYMAESARRFSTTTGPPVPGSPWTGQEEERDRLWNPVRREWRLVERNGVHQPESAEVQGVWHAFAGTGRKARDLHELTLRQGVRLVADPLLWDLPASFEEIVDRFTRPPEGHQANQAA